MSLSCFLIKRLTRPLFPLFIEVNQNCNLNLASTKSSKNKMLEKTKNNLLIYFIKQLKFPKSLYLDLDTIGQSLIMLTLLAP